LYMRIVDILYMHIVDISHISTRFIIYISFSAALKKQPLVLKKN
jgi:hypothetical protein